MDALYNNPWFIRRYPDRTEESESDFAFAGFILNEMLLGTSLSRYVYIVTASLHFLMRSHINLFKLSYIFYDVQKWWTGQLHDVQKLAARTAVGVTFIFNHYLLCILLYCNQHQLTKHEMVKVKLLDPLQWADRSTRGSTETGQYSDEESKTETMHCTRALKLCMWVGFVTAGASTQHHPDLMHGPRGRNPQIRLQGTLAQPL